MSYTLPDSGEGLNDLERLRARGSFRRVAALQGGAERLTAMSAVNSFLSHIILLAGSNRCVEALPDPCLEPPCSCKSCAEP
jgi:hypothetical protein